MGQIMNYRIPVLIVALGLILSFVITWPTSKDNVTAEIGAASAAPATAAISIWEIHSLAHLENLPVDHLEDHSLVFASPRR